MTLSYITEDHKMLSNAPYIPPDSFIFKQAKEHLHFLSLFMIASAGKIFLKKYYK